MTKTKTKSKLYNYKFLLIVFILLAIGASVQSLMSGTKTYKKDGIEYNKYNNYTIFEKSFQHLNEGKDLYILYPEEHWDLYKYSPAFAVVFGVFAIFPDWIGLNLWNLLNALILFGAVYYLPKLSNYKKGLILVISAIELLTSMQNAQSNGLIAGLIILSFGLLEREKYIYATFLIVFAVYIKLFAIVSFVLFLFYPKKWELRVYSIFWMIVFFALPLLFVNVEQLQLLYSSWFNMLSNDHSASFGYSVMGWLHSWFGFDTNKVIVLVFGVLIFLIPLIRIKEYKNLTLRFLTLASILIWVVIFNHKAESPTFIIAMAGVALWFVTSEKSKTNIILFATAFIFTSLSPTDIFPKYLRTEFVKPLMLKVFPCILIWVKIVYDMIVLKSNRIEEKYNSELLNEGVE
jgi:Glycosyltransferase family 87